jgi:succinoglycan biosynthesis transport protein ExoP
VQPDSEGLNIEHALRGLRRRAPLILLCAVLAAGAAYGFSKRQAEKYTATASLAFSNNSLSQQVAGLSQGVSSNSLSQQASNIELVKLGDMAAKTATLLGRGLTEERVSESVSVAGQGESSVVDVSATSTSPLLAAEIANTYSHQFVFEQRKANRHYFRSALALVRKQLAALSPQQRTGPDGLNLQNRAQTLSLLSELGYNNVQVAQEALPPSSPSSPKTSKNTALGGLLGLFVGLGLAFVLERLDRRIKDPKDLESIYRLPMLGVVSESRVLARSGVGGGKQAALLPAEAETFSLIRAHLRFFNIDRDLRTVVVASATPGDGKTTVARRLAEAAARLGSRVLLMEVDLRHPTLAQQLGIGRGPGLTEVLIGAARLDEVTQSIGLEVPPGEGIAGRTLDVLTAGSVLPPNPGELLESRALEVVLRQVKSTYDFVAIDTPPLAVVSDAFPLLTKVDGVVIVGWVGQSRRDAAERLQQVLASSGAPLLGVIANGAKSEGADPYVYARDDMAPTAVASTNGAGPFERVPTART